MTTSPPTKAQLQLLLPPRTHLRVTNRGSFVWLANVDRLREGAMLRLLLAGFLACAVVSGFVAAGFRWASAGQAAALDTLIRHLLAGLAAATALALLCFYCVYIPLAGRNHNVIFDMDAAGLTLIHVQRHAHRGDLRFDLATLADAATGRDSTAGLLTCGRAERIAYAEVQRILLDSENCVVTLCRRGLARHRVYTAEQDFGFIAAFVHKNCPAGTIVRRR